MVEVKIKYNPYILKSDIQVNGKEVGNNSKLKYLEDKRLQEWIEPKRSWNGIFKELREQCGDKALKLYFTGTKSDFEDIEYARENFGDCFDSIELIHENKDSAGEINPSAKMQELEKLYEKLQAGPVEEFKTDDIKRNFENAMNSNFKIVVVAPMSSGKSTLINAILGKDLLPAVNQATTAVITEIKDDDNLDDYYVSADDKYGKSVVVNKRASKDIISDLNYKKDPNDPEGKDALIHKISIEGPIPNIPSDILNTVFVDTPGGNNAQNDEHEDMMDEAINDEDKSLILYVFNGTQLSTNDSNIILRKIANAMKNSTNGKQSRDRFLFVANRMDDFDVSEESYEDVINETIIPMLKENGIYDPNLFLVSAQASKLIRMLNNEEELSESEEEDIAKLLKRFNRCKTRALPKYASINAKAREDMIEEARKYNTESKSIDSRKEQENLERRCAELNSGVPALEYAIESYLEKYAVAIKIKNVHDTFMKKVNERNMIANCEKEWSESKESLEAVQREIQEKKEKIENSNKLKEFKERVSKIHFDDKPIKKSKLKVQKKLDRLVDKSKDRIEMEDLEYELARFNMDLEDVGSDVRELLEDIYDREIKNVCESILNDYSAYLEDLDKDGLLNIGNINMKKLDIFSKFEMKTAKDISKDEDYIDEEDVEVGRRTVKKSGIFAGISRLFGVGGYETYTEYETKQYVKFKEVVQNELTKLQIDFEKEMDGVNTLFSEDVKSLKDNTMKKLDGIDSMIKELLGELELKTSDSERLKEEVTKNSIKTEWIKEFVKEVDSLLDI